ncbi:hypothetical protein Q3G72_007829 [Acer saccharum]|nr:hypothetical protein Q3G72_007829 [Acer saccharum]
MKVAGLRRMATSLVGKVLSSRMVSIDGFRAVMRKIWQTKENVEIEPVVGNIFAFHFRNNEDKQKIISGGPWSFNDALIVLMEPEGKGDINCIKFDRVEFWIQIHNALLMCMSEEIGRFLGGIIGEVVAFDGDWVSWNPPGSNVPVVDRSREPRANEAMYVEKNPNLASAPIDKVRERSAEALGFMGNFSSGVHTDLVAGPGLKSPQGSLGPKVDVGGPVSHNSVLVDLSSEALGLGVVGKNGLDPGLPLGAHQVPVLSLGQEPLNQLGHVVFGAQNSPVTSVEPTLVGKWKRRARNHLRNTGARDLVLGKKVKNGGLERNPESLKK